MEIDDGIPQEEGEEHSEGYLSMDTTESEINISIYLRMSPEDCVRLLRQRTGRAMVSSEVLGALLQDRDVRTQLPRDAGPMLVQALLSLNSSLAESNEDDSEDASMSDEIIDLTSDDEGDVEEPDSRESLTSYIERRVEGTDGVIMSFFLRAEEGLTRAQIKRLPVYRYNARKHKCEQTSCSICLNNFKTLQFLRRLPCFHQFHRKCVDPWLVEKRKCPTCRIDAKPIDVDASEVETYMNSCSQSL